MARNSRRTAAFIVARWLATHEYPAEMLPKGEDRAFVQNLVYVTVRRFRPLRTILGKLLTTWPKGELEALVLIGAAQILYMPEVPDFAAVSETVEAAKACPRKQIAKVVNGVLRNLIRRRAEFEDYLKTAPLAERASYPNALVSRWIARYGTIGAEQLAQWHNEPAETFLAYPPGEKDEVPNGFVKLPRAMRVEDVPGYAAGQFIVQDPATAHAIMLMDVHAGLSVLDWCAAPGGKTIQLAWRLSPKDVLVAHEVNQNRIKRLQKNLARVGCSWVKVTHEPPKTARGELMLFSRVLVDAPCSNSGVLRRRPDARWNWTVQKVQELSALQLTILEEASQYVALDGRLVYSTCSNEPEEDGDVIAVFLARHPNFRECGRQESVPHLSKQDGAFVCALVRNA